MRWVVDHESSEPPALVVEQEAVKGEVTIKPPELALALT